MYLRLILSTFHLFSSSEIDLCDVTPCQNGGTCTFVDSTRTCGCPSTHQGVNCETGNLYVNVFSNSFCIKLSTKNLKFDLKYVYLRLILSTFLLFSSSSEIDLCDVTPCQNGGTCTFIDSTRTCRCPSTHQGVNCETGNLYVNVFSIHFVSNFQQKLKIRFKIRVFAAHALYFSSLFLLQRLTFVM